MYRFFILLFAILLSFVISMSTAPQLATFYPAEVDSLAERLTEQGFPTTREQGIAYMQQAHELAQELFKDNPEKCEEFKGSLIDIFVETAHTDVTIIHNSGGWGKTPFCEDNQWGPVVKEMRSILEEWGYSSTIVSYQRTDSDLLSIMGELRELLSGFTYKAEELATTVRFLVENNPDTKILITGLSQGAAYTNQVMRLLGTNDQIYGIEAGLPFYYREVESNNLLMIEDNGTETDALSEGNVPDLVQSIFIAYTGWILDGFEGGPLGIGGYYAPQGHDYHWDEPGVHSNITDFLQEAFYPNRDKSELATEIRD